MNLYQDTFLSSAKAYPDNLALCTEEKTFTYEELFQLTQEWSEAIRAYNKQDFPVGIYGGRQWQMYAGILSILAAKQTYVPLNNKQPAHRNAVILSQIECQLLLVAENENPSELLELAEPNLIVLYLGEDTPEWLFKFSQHQCLRVSDYINTLNDNEAGDRSVVHSKYAYILFTSGSTGTPKGIAVSHHNVLNYISRLSDLLGIEPTDKVGQFFELSFDLSVHDLFSCWAKGAALYVIPARQLLCPIPFIKNHSLTIFSAVASVLSIIDKFGLLNPNVLPSLRISCFGGEKLLTEQAIKWQKTAMNSRVINLYGPTEFTITASCYELDINDLPTSNSVPIGQPLPGLSAVLIKDGKPVTKSNTLAELYLAGDQIVDGYWEDAGKTSECFLEFESSTGYHYKTGDLVYYDENNNLIFHGRVDHQFKVSGHRVEAADIEACILSYSKDITWCTVKAVLNEITNQNQIVAYIESSKLNDERKIQALRVFCASQLPQYMLPDVFNCFEYLPRNVSGKIDFKALNQIN